MNIERIEKFIRENTKADDFICDVSYNESHETRFAQNGITQHLAGSMEEIRLKVSFGKKSGSSSINQSDEKSLLQLIRTAEDIALLSNEDPEFMPSPGAQELPKTKNFAEATLALKPETMVEIVEKSIEKALALGATVSGMCEKHHHKIYVFTKNGFSGYDEHSAFGHSMTLKKGDVETKVSYEAMDFSGFDLDEEFGRLAAQAEALSKMQSFDAQKIDVILMPEALRELMMYMGWMLSRRQSDEGFTAFTGQLGKPFFGEQFSLYSTFDKPEMAALPFAHGGWGSVDPIACRPTTWVENGVLKNMITDRYWARQVNDSYKFLFNMYIPGTDEGLEALMQKTKRGLIVNRFWYIRPVDMKRGELTGMTRDGVLYFEDGKPLYAVNNLRFNEIPHEFTRRIIAIGKEKLVSSRAIVPMMLIKDFNFVDKTSF